MRSKYTVRLILKGKKKGYGNLYIEIDFNTNGARQRRFINLDEKILASLFVKGKIKSKSTSYDALIEKVDKRIFEVKTKLRVIENKYDSITPELYDQEISKQANSAFKKNPTLIDVISHFIQERSRLLDGRTIQKYKTLMLKIKGFQSEKNKNQSIYLHAVDDKLLTRIQDFYLDQGIGSNTINKYESCLNTILTYCEEVLNHRLPKGWKNFEKIKKEGTDKIVLLKEEIQAINNLDHLTESQKKIRDILIFQLLTGVRFSDLQRVMKGWIVGDSLSFRMFKTNTICQVPLHVKAREILERYDGSFRKIIVSNPHYNRQIKTLGKLASIDQPVEINSKTLNKRESRIVPKYELITSHCARSTFITHCIISGISAFEVMKYVGHQKISTLQIYVKIAEGMTTNSFKKFENHLSL